jgi:mannose-6-phosphate isomerase-like protein (cupin superfamily)
MTVERFLLLQPGETRPGRVPLPPGFGVKATTADTEGKFSALENQLDIATPPHVHEEVDEWVYVLAGEMEVDIDGETHRLTAGMSALLPRGVSHAMRNVSQPPVRALQVSSPAGWECFMEDVFEAGDAARTPDGRMDMGKVNAIGAKHGMRYTESTMAMPAVE